MFRHELGMLAKAISVAVDLDAGPKRDSLALAVVDMRLCGY
jgi:hypothetical protein